MLDPFALDPPGPLDRVLGYWWATGIRLSYHPTRLDLLDQLAAVAGGGGSRRLDVADPSGLVPGLLVSDLPAGRRVVYVQGTTARQQWAMHLLTSQLSAWEGAGRISAGLLLTARVVWAAVGPSVIGRVWAVGGHSFGGGVSAALPGLAGAERPSLLVDLGSPRTGDLEYAAAQTRPRLRLTADGDPIPALPPSTGTFLDELPAWVPSWFDLGPVFFRHWGSRVHLYSDGSTLRPAESQTVAEAATLLRGVLAGEADWAAAHHPGTYCRRIRQGIPVGFPAAVPDPDFFGLEQLDALAVTLNQIEATPWPVTADPAPPVGLPFLIPECGFQEV